MATAQESQEFLTATKKEVAEIASKMEPIVGQLAKLIGFAEEFVKQSETETDDRILLVAEVALTVMNEGLSGLVKWLG